MIVRRVLASLFFAALVAIALATVPTAQQPLPLDLMALSDETPGVWFVELSSPPAVEGTSLLTLRAEKRAFRDAAARAGLRFTERYSFDTLWNGLSVAVDRTQVGMLGRMPGVTALYPVVTIDAPEPADPGPGADLYTALAMTGADVVQSTLGVTGRGVKVAIVDTGIDYDHLYLGGSGVAGGTSFPTARVIAGYDFVGDAFGTTGVPVPDANPDDCNGHGTHVAGIVGAKGTLFKGVAPDVTFGAYRVFGCTGSTWADIMIAAMERALADGMDVLNMSIGSAYQWPQYPTAAAATRLVNRGIVVVASIGNDGEKGLAAAGAPGVGAKVIGVASFNNSHLRLPYFTINSRLFGYNAASGAPAPPTSGSESMTRTGTPTTADDACAALPAGSLSGKVALIRRGTCSFYIKAFNAQSAGATAVVIYNNAAGRVTASVTGTPAIAIPVVTITADDGVFINNALATEPVAMTWTNQVGPFANPTGNVLSSFTSYGLAPDLSLKPDLGAPGGLISSTYPIELGRYAVMSGTSMSSPHVAGAAALYLEAHPLTPSQAMRSILLNTAEPKNWSANPGTGLLDVVGRQGAGLIKIDRAILSRVSIEPAKLSLGESEAGPQTRELTIENHGNVPITYNLSFVNGISVVNIATVSDYTTGTFYNQAFYTSNGTVTFAAPFVVVPAGATATVTATITPPTGPDKGHYGGYLVFTPSGGGTTLRVPYAGFIGNYQSLPVLTPTSGNAAGTSLPLSLPWLAKLVGTSYVQQTAGSIFSMAGSDVPIFLVHFDYQSRLVRMELFDAVSGRAWHRALQLEYFGRNSANGYYAIGWGGSTWIGKRTYEVPNGSYVMKLSVLRALGDENDPADWEIWMSPAFVIAR